VNAPLDPTPNDDPVLRETLKRCSPATYYAACKYRTTGCSDALRTVLIGVVERYVDRDLRYKLLSSPDELRLAEDLGLDSLTLMEIVMLMEEIFPLEVTNEELVQLRRFGDVRRFVEFKVAQLSGAMSRRGHSVGDRSRGISVPDVHALPRAPLSPDHAA
jgi:acyl carrier protein